MVIIGSNLLGVLALKFINYLIQSPIGHVLNVLIFLYLLILNFRWAINIYINLLELDIGHLWTEHGA